MKQNYLALCFLRLFKMRKTAVLILGTGLLMYLIYEQISTFEEISQEALLKQITSSYFSNDACLSSAKWERRAALDSHGEIIIHWNVSDDHIKMMVIGKTKGWIGIGFSLNATMAEADLVFGWVKNGVPHLQDRYAYSNDRPIIDEHNDYELICATETESHTTIIFVRKLNTCDNQDFKIKNFTMRIIWAMSNEDPSNLSFYGPAYHGRMRGSKSLFLLDFKQPKPSEADTRTVDLLINHVNISGKYPTTMWCRPIEIPNIYDDSQIVGYEPLIKDDFKGTVHHILLYNCWIYKVNRTQLKFKEVSCWNWWSMYGSILHCEHTLLTWVIGSEGEFYPPHVGYSLATSEDKLTIFKLEIHYNNARRISGIDNSGIRLYISKKPRPNSASIMAIGYSISYYEIIPPYLQSFMTTGVCPDSCLNETLADKGIRVFALFNHAHSAKTITLRRIRNGVELERIVDEHYDPTYEQAWFFKNEMEIYPGDSILVECVYDTLKQNYTRLGGMTHLDEMCLVYLQYYPIVPLQMCTSIISPKIIHEIVGIKSINTTNYYIIDPHYNPPLHLGKFLTNYKWTRNQTNLLQFMNILGPFVSYCSKRGINTKEKELLLTENFGKSQMVEKRDQC